MNQDHENIPAACSLSDAEFRERQATLLARFRSIVIKTEELPDGYRFTIPEDDHWIVAVAELIAAERRCCRFLKFELMVTSSHEPVVLSVTGPEGTKDFLRMTFCKLELFSLPLDHLLE